eukprot:TRINITY_DN75885_c0_g1_i1.p1 TRINITY_DN75885_c0_g1~~TRINITY_DN75885_c0_g1_i1.p1  ORF type:complete len:215 (-),score=18.25 TRINITY_DN75885_c0_g1_i1:109-753(-)
MTICTLVPLVFYFHGEDVVKKSDLVAWSCNVSQLSAFDVERYSAFLCVDGCLPRNQSISFGHGKYTVTPIYSSCEAVSPPVALCVGDCEPDAWENRGLTGLFVRALGDSRNELARDAVDFSRLNARWRISAASKLPFVELVDPRPMLIGRRIVRIVALIYWVTSLAVFLGLLWRYLQGICPTSSKGVAYESDLEESADASEDDASDASATLSCR